MRFVTLCVVTLLAGCEAAEPAHEASSELATSFSSSNASNASNPRSCERAAVVRTAPAALASGISIDLAQIAAAGGTPLEDPGGDRVIFVAQGPGDWRASGSFSGWDPNGGVALHSIAGTDLATGTIDLPRGQSFQYKLVHDGQFVEDPLAQNVVWDGIDRGFGVRGQMNGIVHAASLPPSQGRTVSLGKLDGRSTWIHYPAAYDSASCARLPSIIIHDGMESLTRGAFAETADALYAQHPELAAVLVFVDVPTPESRMAQYTVYSDGSEGASYVDWLQSTLLPLVDSRSRLCTSAAAHGIAGASLGGLISTYAGFEHPDTWGWIGSQSGSFFWDDDAMISRVSALPKESLRIYLDSGQQPDPSDDNYGPTNELDGVLTSKGYDHVRITEPGGQHDWPYWRGRLPGMLTHFRQGQTSCD